MRGPHDRTRVCGRVSARPLLSRHGKLPAGWGHGKTDQIRNRQACRSAGGGPVPVIFEKSVPGRRGVSLPLSDVPETLRVPEKYRRTTDAPLCELSELDVVRHFTALSHKNYGVDTNFYPLGSCTMKYNPKITEKIAALAGFSQLHPLLPQLRRGGMLTQGALAVLFELEQL